MKPSFSYRYDGTPLTGSEVSLSPDGKLRITAEVREFPDSGAVEWLLRLENTSSALTGIVSDLWDCDIVLPLPEKTLRTGYKGTRRVISTKGMVDGGAYCRSDKRSALEHSAEEMIFYPGDIQRYESLEGRSSDGQSPFFEISAEDMGYYIAIGWSGGWKAEAEYIPEGIRFRSGLRDAKFYLEPHERFRTTSILIMPYGPGEDGSNKFRRLIREHFSHTACTGAEREGLCAFELWGGLPSGEMVRRLRELKDHGIRCEDIWVDAGWYGNCEKCDEPFTGDWACHTGEWEMNPRVHPEEMRDVRDAAEDAGAHLMLWIEPERIFRGVGVESEHPDWFLRSPDPGEASRLLWYGNEDALRYVEETVSHYIRDLRLSCYRQDFNTCPRPFFRAADAPDREGITEIYHILGMYRLWDSLLARFPGLIIDNCSSGGRRIDLETIQRSIPFFRSDFQCGFDANADVTQVHNSGISRYLPYNGCTTKCLDLYALRSSYSSSWGSAFYNAVFQSMDEDGFALAKRAYDDYQSIRPYLSRDFYDLGSRVLDDAAWAIWQYDDPEKGEGAVLAFRRERSPFESVTLKLCNVSGVVKYTSLDDGGVRYSDEKLTITLPEKRSSAIIRYEMI